MFRLNDVLGYLKEVLNYSHSQLLDFCNVVPGITKGDNVMLKGMDVEEYLGVSTMRALESRVVMIINL